jgi:hypothetical protein
MFALTRKTGMQMDLKDGLLKQSPSAPHLDDLSGWQFCWL